VARFPDIFLYFTHKRIAYCLSIIVMDDCRMYWEMYRADKIYGFVDRKIGSGILALSDGAWNVRHVEIIGETGKGLYGKILKIINAKYGTIQSDTIRTECADRAWRKIKGAAYDACLMVYILA